MSCLAVSGESDFAPGGFLTGANSSSRGTWRAAMRLAWGKVSKIKSSNLIPLLAVGLTRWPDASTNGIFLCATCNGNCTPREPSLEQKLLRKGMEKKFTQICASPKSSRPCASVASASSFDISEYSTTAGAPFASATTPTGSCGSRLGTVFEAQSASRLAQKPRNVGSATWHRMLSTPNWKIHRTPRASSSLSSPESRSDT
mmetsp:Transcript_7175/g.18704  ORF Transcript_7175/g.18704 Transcript_7175/m.18704 type:complete len:201 (+) Transcript_7175:415-1017(+)